MCFCSKVKKQLPTKLQSALERNKSYSILKPGLQDKDSIFKLASNPKSFYELQKKLQVGQKLPVLMNLTINTSIATKVVCFSRLPKCLKGTATLMISMFYQKELYEP